MRPFLLPVVVVVAACGTPEPAGDAPEVACVDDATFFREEVYPKVVRTTCMSCHTETGLARGSDLVFVSPSRPDSVEVNASILADVAGLERDGTSLVLTKPLGGEAHGGGVVYREDDAAYALLVEYVRRLDEPVVCDGPGDERDDDAGLVLLSPAETYRKAALVLGGRLPTGREIASVRAGGEPALVTALWSLMAEEAFLDVFKERLNDVLLTDRYLINDDGLGIVDDERFPTLYDYRDQDDADLARRLTADAIAREPLEIAAHVLREDLPWSEVLTADYTVVNAYSAMAYGLSADGYPAPGEPGAEAFFPATIPAWPHAGLLTTPAFLNRYPTTDTNRNRHRTWAFFKKFLATDILTFADRPIDPTISEVHNPTLNDPQCTVCHAEMDPVAGLFQDWDAEGRLAPREEGWYSDMVPPGWGGDALPSSYRSDGLRFLAERTVADPRFRVAAVRMVLEAYAGVPLLTAQAAGDDPALLAALDAQDRFVAEVAEEMGARGDDLKVAVERVVLSRYFRAVEADGASDGALVQAGTARLLTPEELDRKIVATLGLPWRGSSSADPYLLDDYRMLYGGIDSFGVTERLHEPNGVIAAIGLRLATEMACEAVPHDFVVPRAQRRLFPHVEPTYAPFTADGFAVPDAELAIRRNLVALHERLLGETLTPGDAEIDATYALWLELQQAGAAAVRAGELDDDLPDDCRATRDPFSGDSLPEGLRLDDDPDHTIRAWAGVVAYLIADWRFTHE